MLSFVKLIAFLVLFSSSEACKCIPIEDIKITAECPGHFLSIVQITGVEHVSFSNNYKFKVIADYTTKMAEKKAMSEFPVIMSADSGAACGVNLKVDDIYLIFGSVQKNLFARLVICGSIVRKLETIPTEEEAMKMLEGVYNSRCVVH